MSSSTMRFTIASGSTPSSPRPVVIQTRRSSLATSSSAPSSTPLRPSFHESNTRTPYSTGASGLVVGTNSTAICAPLRDSNSARVCSSAERCCSFRVAVRSVTRALSGGTATCAVAARTTKTRLLGEINFRRLRDRLLVLDRELRLLLVAEHHRRQVGRERAHRDVVLLHRLDEAVARHGDAVLGAFELRLQLEKVPVRLELRVVLDDHQQAGEGAGELALRLRELLQRPGVVDRLGRDLHRADLGAGVGHAEQDLLLLRGEALHGGDQVRDEVGAPLILVHHLGPRGLDLLVLSLEGV